MTVPSRPLPLATTAALLALASLTGCSASADGAPPDKRDFGPAGSRLTIAKDQGDLDIRPADVKNVQVTRWFDRWSLIGGKPTATWERSGDRLTLATDCGTLIGGCAVRYQVLVPRDLAVDVQGQNGRISATGFGAALRIRSDNGEVTVDAATGPLDLGTENGEVRSTATRSPRVSATTQSGEVDLSFAAPPDQVAVTTENGGVKVTVPRAAYQVTTRTDSGDVHAGIPNDASAPRSITARTDNGAITLNTMAGG